MSSSIQEMTMLTRRSSAFAQTVKLLALLGWTVQPLAGRLPNADGEYCMVDCMLTCTACGAFIGLWSIEAAPDTFGKLGHHGLVGQWGPGRQAHSRSLREFSIAGGLEQDAGAQPSLRSDSGGDHAALLDEHVSEPAPFGAAASGPVFGSSVSLTANAKATRAPLGAKKPKANPQNVSPVVVGKKHSREPDDEPMQSRVAKVIRKLSATQECHLDADVAQKLKERGLQVCSNGALDIVHAHRAWCPWVSPEGVEGWRRALSAVVLDVQDDDQNAAEATGGASERVSATSDVGLAKTKRHSASILHSVTAFLNRFNHGSPSQELEIE